MVVYHLHCLGPENRCIANSQIRCQLISIVAAASNAVSAKCECQSSLVRRQTATCRSMPCTVACNNPPGQIFESPWETPTCGDSNVWSGGLLQATVMPCQCQRSFMLMTLLHITPINRISLKFDMYLTDDHSGVSSIMLAWRQTPEMGSGVVAFTDLAAQLEMQNYIYWYTFCHL